MQTVDVTVSVSEDLLGQLDILKEKSQENDRAIQHCLKLKNQTAEYEHVIAHLVELGRRIENETRNILLQIGTQLYDKSVLDNTDDGVHIK